MRNWWDILVAQPSSVYLDGLHRNLHEEKKFLYYIFLFAWFNSNEVIRCTIAGWLWRSAWCLLLNKWIFKCKQIFEHFQFNCALWTFITWLILRRMIYYTLYSQCISTNNAGKKTWCWINAIVLMEQCRLNRS